ncbi:MAG: dTMP kinase [Candidatus Parcubacteria bacterium]|nr:dTMP kinase [Candidatus Parcubacteria bacterium]
MKAKFIAIEGGEGSGKSSLVKLLKEVLADTAVITREPGGSPYGEAIRDMALKNPLAKDAPPATTLSLMFASRFDHIANTVKPALTAGKPVITDRFDGSSFAYNIWAQANGGLEKLFWNLRSHLDLVPDLYIYLDVDPKEGTRRAQARNAASDANGKYDHFDDRHVEFHGRVREGYLKFFAKRKWIFFPKIPHVIIDANRSLEEVKQEFMAVVQKELTV